MAKQTSDTSARFGVHSEVGQLRKVMVCSPGRAHQRLTPSNCDTLLFDDVLWVDNAKRDHFDFVQKMRDRGVDVVEMHNLLAETVAIPEARKWILDNQVEAVYIDDNVRRYETLWALIEKEIGDSLEIAFVSDHQDSEVLRVTENARLLFKSSS